MPARSHPRALSRAVFRPGLALLGLLAVGCGTGGGDDDGAVWVERDGRALAYSPPYGEWVSQARACVPAGADGQVAYHETFDLRSDWDGGRLFARVLLPANVSEAGVSVSLHGTPLVGAGGEGFVESGRLRRRNPLVVEVRTPAVDPFWILVEFTTDPELQEPDVARLRIHVEWSGPCDVVPAGDAIVFAGTPAALLAQGISPGTVGGTDAEIWRLHDGVATPLTDNAVEDDSPAWSPSKDLVAFTRLVPAPSPVFFRWVVMVMAADGSAPTTVGDFAGESALHPAWSPSGSLLAVAVGDPGFGRTGIRVIDLSRAADDPDRILTLTDGSREDLRPTWSPDAAWIAFQRDLAAILRVPSNGSLAPTPMLDAPNLAPAAPDWGPRGLLLQGYDAVAFGYRVLWLEPDGTQRWVTSGGSHLGDYGPRWSADGLRAVFAREGTFESSARLRVGPVDAPGTDAEVVGQPAGPNRSPDW